MSSENVLFMFDNQIDRGVVAATTEESTMPASNLQDHQRSSVWRSTTAASPQDIDFTRDASEAEPVSIVALVDHNLSPAATIRLRCWSAGLDSGDPDIDETIQPWEGFTGYGMGSYGLDGYGGTPSAQTRLLLRPVTFIPLPDQSENRYWRITLDDDSLSYVQCGRIYFGHHWQPSVNMNWGWRFGRDGRTRHRESRGGQQYGNARAGRTVLDIDLDWLDEADRDALWLHYLAVEDHTPVIVCPRPTSDIEQILTAIYARFEPAALTHDRTGSKSKLRLKEVL